MASVGDETCRICRSEGTPEEPLYHPCKCSGSIKYVHQDCLLEWLQHSQKKHCELCKTSFRFTKVYDPHMPKTLPFLDFIKLALKHVTRLIIQILRLSSVLFVWLFWLPWTVRTVWRFYFYVADGGLLENSMDRASPTSNVTFNTSMIRTPTLIGLIGPDVASTIDVQDVPSANSTAQERLADYFLQPSNFRIGAGLANLTSSTQFNQVMVDTFEGQVITILVVLAFILIFLIREWVVQQQPPQPLDANGQPVQQQDPRVDELLAEIERHRQRREANIQAEAGNQQAPHPQPMFASGDEAEAEDNSSEESVFGGNDSELSFQAGRTEESDGEMQFNFEEPAPVDIGELSFSTTRPAFMPDDDDDDDEEEDEAEQTPILPSDLSQEVHSLVELSSSDNEASTSQAPPSGLRPIHPLRKRKIFQSDNISTPTPPEESSFAFQSTPTTSPFQFGSTSSQPSEQLEAGDIHRRPNMSRELSGQAAELRRAIEERKKTEHLQTQQWDTQILDDLKEEADDLVEEEEPSTKPSEPVVENTDFEESGPGLVDSTTQSQEIAESSSAAVPNAYNFDLASSGSDFNWNKYTEYSQQAEQSISGKGKAPALSARESSTGSDVSRKRASDMSWEELAEMKEQTSTEASGDEVPQITAFDDVSSDDDVDFHEEVQREILARAAERFGDNDGRIAERIRNNKPISVQEIADLVRNSQGAQTPAIPPPEPVNRQLDEDPRPEPVAFAADGDNEIGAPIQPPAAEAAEAVVVNAPPPPPPAAPAPGANGAPEDEVDVDVDDFDGVMELIGMRGPLLALAQNGIFSAVLISATIGVGVWMPYIWGRIVLLILSNPLIFFITLPYKAVIFTIDLFIDLAIMFGSFLVHFSDRSGRFLLIPASWVVPKIKRVVNSQATADMTYKFASEAHGRISKSIGTIFTYRASMRQLRHQQILGPPYKWPTYQSWDKIFEGVSKAANTIGLNGTDISLKLNRLVEPQQQLSQNATSIAGNNTIFNATSLNMTESGNSTFVQDSLAAGPQAPIWTPFDRVVTVIAGYVFISIIGAFYLQYKKNLAKKGIHPRGLDRKVVEILGQAGSVMKVVLIIGIEMFVFPLYCGFLLDLALLPLFEHATVWNRWLFLKEFVFTSLFVHWFIGTCYMFHFALFVSMCRTIMRDGVLYFIRDPDDPTFHPVKEVLERPVTTQLKKIGFSAIIYGVLVILFLGGVVWALHYSFAGLLPVHWSSNEPVLEFPVDLLFYNIFMPLAIKYFRPANILEEIYGWWFRQCAKVLRLSSFMFGDRRPEEEGVHVRKTWTAWLLRRKGDLTAEGSAQDESEKDHQPTPDVSFERNGRFVRAPAKDSVRPSRENLFIPVTESNERIDGKDDPADGDFGPNSENVTLVYLPPNFKTRIGFVIGLIWFFAAGTGVALTVVPLVFGRFILGTLLPGSLRMNDLYAFSLGLYALGAVVLAVSSFNAAKEAAKRVKEAIVTIKAFRKTAVICAIRALKITYILLAFVVVLPTLFAFVMEAYIILPLHTYFSTGENHVIHFIQDWTLGVLYVKMLGRMILLDRESAWARSLRAIIAQGVLNPDIGIATKKFIIPASSVMLASLAIPLAIGYGINNFIVTGASDELSHQIYRYSYPAVFLITVVSVGIFFLYRLFDAWKQSLRDEMYLVGEQLHNYGERRPPPQASVAPATAPTLEEATPLLDAQGQPNVVDEADEPQEAPQGEEPAPVDAARDSPVQEFQRMDSSVQVAALP